MSGDLKLQDVEIDVYLNTWAEEVLNNSEQATEEEKAAAHSVLHDMKKVDFVEDERHNPKDQLLKEVKLDGKKYIYLFPDVNNPGVIHALTADTGEHTRVRTKNAHFTGAKYRVTKDYGLS